jgi:hypothetical protein
MKPPFCSTPAAIEAFRRWRGRLEAAGVELGEPDEYVVAIAATREARLQELAEELAKVKRPDRRARIVAQERLAAGDMTKALELLERTFGASVAEAVAPEVKATGTDGHVLAFRPPGQSPRVKALVAAVAKRGPMTKAEMRGAVRGGQGEFLRAIREAVAAGVLRREGAGSKSRPYRYRASGG